HRIHLAPQDLGDLSHEHVADRPSADGGEDADDDAGQRRGTQDEGLERAGDGEDRQADGVEVLHRLADDAQAEPGASPPEVDHDRVDREDRQTRQEHGDDVAGLADAGRRDVAEQHVPQDAAAQPVAQARTATPKMSRRARTPTSPPEMANAKIPTRSRASRRSAGAVSMTPTAYRPYRQRAPSGGVPCVPAAPR